MFKRSIALLSSVYAVIMPVQNRIDCGVVTSTLTSCLASGCLWNLLPSGVPGPSCYYPPVCSADVVASQRIDCGTINTNENQCIISGCCWNALPSGVSGPYCFFGQSTPFPSTIGQSSSASSLNGQSLASSNILFPSLAPVVPSVTSLNPSITIQPSLPSQPSVSLSMSSSATISASPINGSVSTPQLNSQPDSTPFSQQPANVNSNSSQDQGKSSQNNDLYIGIACVVGAILGISVIAFLLFLRRRRASKKTENTLEQNPFKQGKIDNDAFICQSKVHPIHDDAFFAHQSPAEKFNVDAFYADNAQEHVFANNSQEQLPTVFATLSKEQSRDDEDFTEPLSPSAFRVVFEPLNTDTPDPNRQKMVSAHTSSIYPESSVSQQIAKPTKSRWRHESAECENTKHQLRHESADMTEFRDTKSGLRHESADMTECENTTSDELWKLSNSRSRHEANDYDLEFPQENEWPKH